MKQTIDTNWRCGRHVLHRILCHSENSKGVYCLQYDDQKIVSGLRDNTIKVMCLFKCSTLTMDQPNVPINLSWQCNFLLKSFNYNILLVTGYEFSENIVKSLSLFSVCLLVDMGQKHFRMCESVNRPHWICFVSSI